MTKYIKAIVNLSIALVVLLLIFFLLPQLVVFFMPFIVGFIISLVASPLVLFLEKKLKIKRKMGSAITIITVIALVLLVAYLVGIKMGEEVSGFMNSLPEIVKSIEHDFKNIGNNWGNIYDKLPADMKHNISNLNLQLNQSMGDLFSIISTPTISAVGNFAKSLPSFIISAIMTLLSAYFFVADRKEVNDWFEKTMPKTISNKYQILKKSLVKAVGGYIKAQLKIELWVFLILFIGLLALRVDFAILVSLGIAFMDFLPFFGTGTIMVPWAIIRFLNNDYQFAIWILIIWGVGQLVRQIIQPKIVGDSIGVPPIPTLFLLFIGFKMCGVIGMILAVPIGIIVYTMYEEGVFDTTKNSLHILINGINQFRELKPEDIDGDNMNN